MDQPLQIDDADANPSDYHFDKGDVVTFIVGPNKHELLAHANYIARKSAFFKTALKKEWREGKTGTITMPEDDYKAVTNYLRFINSDKLPTSHVDIERREAAGYFERFYISLANLYVFGSKIMDKDLKTSVIKEIHRLSFGCSSIMERWCIPGVDAVNIIYDGTTEADPARRLLLDLYTSRGSIIDLSQDHHPCFMYLLSRYLMTMAASTSSSSSYRDRRLAMKDYLN